jgi:co-chaperonin GroES (HSP10)
MVDRMSEAAETGTLIAIGSKAWAKSSDEKPEVGQRVIFEKYAGSYQWGADGRRYRLMDDRCIGGLVIEPKPQTLTKVTKPSIIVTRGA